MNFILLCILILLSGFFYVVGGRDKNDKQIKKYDFLSVLPNWIFTGIVRDIGCTACSIAACWLFFPHIEAWQWICFIVLQIVACRSYFTFINMFILDITHCYGCSAPIDSICEENICHYAKKAREKKWYNWLMVGLVSKIKWVIVGLNPIILIAAIGLMVFSETKNNPIEEELYRGFWII